jgi:single-strand DNA-binding protein
LAGGATVVQFDVTTTLISSADEPAGRSNVSVPIAWTDPPATTLAALGQGDEVVVVGSVRRRFFRSGGMTQSRTEVVPEHVVPARRTKTVRSMLAAAAEALVC